MKTTAGDNNLSFMQSEMVYKIKGTEMHDYQHLHSGQQQQQQQQRATATTISTTTVTIDKPLVVQTLKQPHPLHISNIWEEKEAFPGFISSFIVITFHCSESYKLVFV